MSDYTDQREAEKHAREYLAANREEFPGEAWRYLPTAVAFGSPLTDFTGAELRWYIGGLQRQREQAVRWPGLVPYTDEQIAEFDRRIREAKDALRVVGTRELEAETA